MGDLVDLGRRAVACRDWRWRRGMMAVGRRSVPLACFRIEVEDQGPLIGEWALARPDLGDDGTLGCLEALLFGLCGGIFEVFYHVDGGWGVVVADRTSYGDTKAEALVTALESASTVIR